MNLAHALLAITFGLFTAVAGAEPLPMKLQPKKASERVYYFEGEPAMASSANRAFNSNAAFVVTNDGVVVFDALGTPALGAAMKAAIANVTTAADPARHRQPLPRGSLLRTAGARRSGRRDLGARQRPRGARLPVRPGTARTAATRPLAGRRPGHAPRRRHALARLRRVPGDGVRARRRPLQADRRLRRALARRPDAVGRERPCPDRRRSLLQRPHSLRRQRRQQGVAGGDGPHRPAEAGDGHPGSRDVRRAIRSRTST